MGQTGPGRDNEGGQKVQQPNGEVEGPEGWCDLGKEIIMGRVIGRRALRRERQRTMFSLDRKDFKGLFHASLFL